MPWQELALFETMLQQNPELAKQFQEQYAQLGASMNPNPAAPRHAIVKPKPGFVVKTKDEAGQKVFVNLCSSERVRPSRHNVVQRMWRDTEHAGQAVLVGDGQDRRNGRAH